MSGEIFERTSGAALNDRANGRSRGSFLTNRSASSLVDRQYFQRLTKDPQREHYP
jgi:hypothetical protein